MLEALNKAIEYAGGQAALAEKLTKLRKRKVWQSVVRGWIIRERVPSDWCPAIEKVLQGKVKASDLRPDTFGGA
jgi:DNA-binding transcriptional regulator YdaS (Cro superfamily)